MGAIVSYKDEVIHEATDGDVFTLNTEGCYLEDDIEIAVDVSLPTAEGVEF